MKKATVRTHNANVYDTAEYANFILKSMRENTALFPEPYPTLDDFEKLVRNYEQAIVDASYRDRMAVIQRDQIRVEVIDAIRLLSYYVNRVAKGDELIIYNSGFTPSKDGDYSDDVPMVTDFTVKAEIGTGAIKLSVKRWERARMYQFEYRKKGSDAGWEVVMSSRSRCTIENLEVREEYEFRVLYVGKNKKSAYSHVVRSWVY